MDNLSAYLQILYEIKNGTCMSIFCRNDTSGLTYCSYCKGTRATVALFKYVEEIEIRTDECLHLK